ALRDRKEDIPLLIHFYISRKAKKHNKVLENISKADMQRLCDYDWPGNIRELKNVIERSVISTEGNTLRLDWFYHGIAHGTQLSPVASSLEQVEKDHILKMLQDSNWKINGENGAAEKLAMHPSTLRSKMKKLNIDRNGNETG
ncbi:MAG TPA: helix-turn-helix domain-containing protein, partial [Agriterribacter sp.]|nr:helix-turn-helix domain-containing protein [Agriterribacter sp.]